MALDLDSDKASKLQSQRRTQSSDRSGGTLLMVRAIYSTGLYIYIHRITSAWRMCEVRPSLLIREGNTLLVRYSLDTHARYSTYSPNFKSQKDSIEALNFCIITL